MFARWFFPVAALSLWATALPAAEPCFPFESLPTPLRVMAQHYLSNALDRSAVFTLAGGIKPVSDDIGYEEVRRGSSPVPYLAQMRAVAAAFQCEGRFEAAAVLTRPDEDGDRQVRFFVADVAAFRAVLRKRHVLFGRLGISAHDALEHVLFTVENAAEPARSRALGALYGYPYEAAEYYASRARVDAEGPQRHLRPVRIAGVNGDPRFIYMVPRDTRANETERRLRARCASVRASYRRVGRALAGGEAPLPEIFVREWIARDPEMFPPASCKIVIGANAPH